MKGYIFFADNKDGYRAIHSGAIEMMSLMTALSVKGCGLKHAKKGMDLEAFNRLGKRYVELDVVDHVLHIKLTIDVVNGYAVDKIAYAVQKQVKEEVAQSLGMKIGEVDVTVENVIFN
ncbi:MAG: Asp23/Gls24 family envelope stress response protein [Culicoidibacterales bacterium]